jgi:hypothetical protein
MSIVSNTGNCYNIDSVAPTKNEAYFVLNTDLSDNVANITAGPGIAVDVSGTTTRVSNTGTLGVVAGDGIDVSLNPTTGIATVTNTGVLEIIAGIGMTVNPGVGIASISTTATPLVQRLNIPAVQDSSGVLIDLSGYQPGFYSFISTTANPLGSTGATYTLADNTAGGIFCSGQFSTFPESFGVGTGYCINSLTPSIQNPDNFTVVAYTSPPSIRIVTSSAPTFRGCTFWTTVFPLFIQVGY